MHPLEFFAIGLFIISLTVFSVAFIFNLLSKYEIRRIDPKDPDALSSSRSPNNPSPLPTNEPFSPEVRPTL